ncbi:hypothetical protein [Streptomyces sp. NBC_00878]|uniref:hypothetical protein n=1 Tax=Streptomyces sp. NBC_00878 TaxID=2975854 RepID=UPI002250455A|nr:hypothetical protein [Streptomyces sp. NBC_00878]MCX4910845.1 hypothetical protein [Streptomyces sp. NBC_00878]
MHLNYTAMVIAVVILGLAAAGLARGRMDPPFWLAVATGMVVFPLTSALLDRAEEPPDRLLLWAFQGAVTMLVSVLLSPLLHAVRRRTRRVAPDGPDAMDTPA